jgi:hypothetical protein
MSEPTLEELKKASDAIDAAWFNLIECLDSEDVVRTLANMCKAYPHYCKFCGAGEREASECEDVRCDMQTAPPVPQEVDEALRNVIAPLLARIKELEGELARSDIIANNSAAEAKARINHLEAKLERIDPLGLFLEENGKY